MSRLSVVICNVTVNSGEYIQAVCDRNLAENISRVLYPNDNVRVAVLDLVLYSYLFVGAWFSLLIS